MLNPRYNTKTTLINTDGFWKFLTDPDATGEANNWFNGLDTNDEIAVPASWNEQKIDLFDYFGIGWYEKEVDIPLEWSDKLVKIRIGAVFSKMKLWVNGEFSTFYEGSHLPITADITNLVKFGEKNRITVMVDDRLDPWTLPPAGLDENEGRDGFVSGSYPYVCYDFYPFGGIERPVHIYCLDELNVDDITIKTDIDGTVKYDIVLSKASDADVEITTDGQTVKVNMQGKDTVSGEFKIENPKLWGIGKPNLYEMEIKVVKNGEVCDSYVQTYGIRKIEVSGDKLLLNGEQIFLKGFGKHEDFHVIGKGYNPALIVKDFDLMRWIGANSFRTSHYPYADEWLEYADRHGVLVIDETPFVGLNERMYTPEILEKAKGIIRQLMQRDKNHPSVIMWSLCNEPVTNGDYAEHFFKEMADLARSLDDTRPITYVAFLYLPDNPYLKYYDVVCFNKYLGWYTGAAQIDATLPILDKSIEDMYNAFKKPIIMTEFGADAIEGMHSNPHRMFTEEFQTEIIAKQYELFKSKPYCAGAHIWAFADFMACQGISRILYNRKGVFTRDRNPKMVAYKLKELWSEE